MNIACSNCPAKYAVPDDKVRGRKVKITCKRCGATIIVDGTLEGGPAVGGAAGPVSARSPAQPAPVLWTVAVTEEDHQEMTAAQVGEAYKKGVIDSETFVWREGMADWLTPFEIPDIEAALRALGIERPKAATAEPAKAETPAPGAAPRAAAPVEAAKASAAPRPSGWREPGRWDGGKAGSELTFDDVTVAMAAPKAQALLDAISTAENPAPPAPEAPAPAPSQANPFADDEATIVADSSRFALASEQEPARAAPRPAAGAPAETPKSTAAEVAEPAPDTSRSQDPFAPREKQPSVAGRPRPKLPSAPGVAPRAVPEPQSPASMTGARSDSSVLFSLDQLVGKEKPRPSAARDERIDANALVGRKSGPDSAPPSLANLAAGPLFTAPVMAAPDFNAPPASSKPMHSAPSASTGPVSAPKPTGGSGRWLLAALLVLGVGGAAAFFLMRPAAAPPAPEAAQTAAPPPPTPVAEAVPPAAPSGAPAAEPETSAAAPVASVTASAPAASEQGPKAATGPAPKKAGPGAPAAPAVPAPAAAAEGPPFDAEAAKAALASAASAAQGQCSGEDGPHGGGKVTVTFVNSGRATNALVAGDFAGSALGGCVARVFRGAKVPAFSGDSVRVTKSVQIP